MSSDVLARVYLVSSAANPKGLSERANPQGLSSAWYKPRLGSPSHSTAEVLRQVRHSFDETTFCMDQRG